VNPCTHARVQGCTHHGVQAGPFLVPTAKIKSATSLKNLSIEKKQESRYRDHSQSTHGSQLARGRFSVRKTVRGDASSQTGNAESREGHAGLESRRPRVLVTENVVTTDERTSRPPHIPGEIE
jgi:hypothetical protein